MKKPIEDFLDRATEGLRDDEELRRDARAELATHAEEKLRELTESGASDEAAADEVLKALGNVVDVAGEMQGANRHRMTFRAQARMLLRFALVPIAVVVAVLTSDLPSMQLREVLFGLTSDITPGYIVPPLASVGEKLFGPRYTPEELLVLHGDTTRGDHVAQQRAIWEASPTSVVYLGNYISTLIASPDMADGAHLDHIRAELQSARKLEPDNARFDLLEAALLVNYAVDLSQETSETKDMARTGSHPKRYSLMIHDEAMLDEAMTLLRSGLGKPYWRRYSDDMLRDRLQIYGPGERFGDFIKSAAVAASVVLPDLKHLLNLGRTGVAYGERLLADGRTEDAGFFLAVPHAMGRQLAGDSFTLIDMLGIGAFFNISAEEAAEVYRRAGMDEEAARLAARSRAAAKPINDWKTLLREQRDNPEMQEGDRELLRRGSVVTGYLLPALGSYPSPAAYEPSRRLEYTVATEVLLAMMSSAFLVAMLGCLLVALRWRLFGSRGAAIPILLVPDLRRTAWTILLGVLLPIGLFLVVTRNVGWSGHSYSIHFGGHKLIAEFALLAAAVAAGPLYLTWRAVKERCVDLGLPVTRFVVRHVLWGAAVGAAALLVLWLFPATGSQVLVMFTAVAAGLTIVSLDAWAIGAWVQGMAGRKENGLYYGTLFRSLIPIFAAVVVVLGLVVRPYLLHSEATYLARDTLMNDPGLSAFSKMETEITQRLKSETLAAMEALDAVEPTD